MSDDAAPPLPSLETLRRLAAHCPDILILIGPDGAVEYVNRVQGGYSADDVLGQTSEAFVGAEGVDAIRAASTRAAATRTTQRVEAYVPGPDGVARTYDVRIAPIFEGDVFGGFAVCSRDVTDARGFAHDFERFFDLSEDYLGILDGDGTILRISPSIREQGLDPDLLVGASIVDEAKPEDRPALRAALAEARGRAEFRICKGPKPERLIDATFIRSDVAGGRIYALARDITHERARQEQMVQTQKMEIVGQLAGGVAHDFNNLLQSVLVNADHALDSVTPDSDTASYLRDLRSAALMSADLTRQLLAFSRRETFRPRQVDLGELTRRILSMLRRTIPENIDISYVPGSEVRTVTGDSSQLEQVLVNLALNARDSLIKGGRITISTQDLLVDGKDPAWTDLRLGRYTVLSVADTGPGIPPAIRDRIFEPFFTTKGRWGTGLGLAIVKDVVDRHEGHVRVTTSSEGTRFDVCLPVSSGATLSSENDPIVEPERGRGELILLAEDEPFVRRAISRALRRAGYTVTLAEDGVEALAILDSGEKVDLLLLDVVMPNLGGPGVVQGARERGLDLPIILASGYTDTAMIDGLPDEIPVLQKPYHPDRLLTLLRELLDASGGEEGGE